MGSGCSRMPKAKNVRLNGTGLTAKPNGTTDSINKLDDEALEEDDELDALSPISAITKVGSTRTRGLSAASTVLPGTSISLSPAMEELSELQAHRPLPDFSDFSELSRNLLLNRGAPYIENTTLNEMALLVLCNGEDALEFFKEVQREVLPSLNDMCFRKDYSLSVFTVGHQVFPCGSDFRRIVVSLARNLLKSSRLMTMTIFGRSSIKVQPPDTIVQADFDSVVSRMPSAESRELVHSIYVADGNALKPCYRLSPRALKSEDWPTLSERILAVLEASMNEGDKDLYLTTVFEDLLRTLLNIGDQRLRHRSFLVYLEHSTLGDRAPKKADIRVQHMLSTWEDIIPDDYKFNFFVGHTWQELDPQRLGADLEGLQTKLVQAVADMIDDCLPDGEKVSLKDVDRKLLVELIHQQNEVQNHLKTFQDRPELVSSIMNYIAGPQSYPLVLHGRQGRGKSSLLAVTSVLCGAVFPHMPVILRSALCSPESLTQEQMLRSICEQLAVLYGEHPSLASRSIAEHNHYLSKLLKKARAERPMVIIVDGLDQVEEQSGRSLQWLPVILPQHVKLILGLRDGTGELQELQDLLKGEESVFLEVPDMKIEETLSIIKNQMRTKGRRLTDSQMNFARICATDNSYPRYAHLFAQVASTWNSNSIPEHYWEKHALFDVFSDYLSHVSATVNMKVIKYFLAALLTPKHGLLQSEVLDLLQSADVDMNGLSGDPVVPVYMIQQLNFLLRTCTKRRRTYLQLKSQIFRKLCRNFVGGTYLNQCLTRLLEYFEDGRVPDDLKMPHKHQRWRSLEELTHLRIRLHLPVRSCFFDHWWLLDRVCAGDPYLMLEEIKMYKRRNPDDRELDLLRKFLQLSAFALRYDGRQLFTQLYGRIRGFYVEPGNSIKYPSIKDLYKTSATPPVPSFLSQGPCLKTVLDLQKPVLVSSSEIEHFDDIMWLDREGRYLVTFSSRKSEVSAWNVVQVKKIASLCDVTEIDCMVSMQVGAEVLLLHHSRIELYDLAKGTMKVQMVELVDTAQGAKVLAGGRNVLAVSAGHDEILTFETYSGHVVSRIVAEGKRILDQLVVSENEEVCVCGDSFRKPYPLLVWSLKSRELLHEFSRAHHEFTMRHTRLNSDGTLLFTVIKELLDSSPSYVQAYDLITGSILWEIRTESAISAMDVCASEDTVIASTEYGTLSSWKALDGTTSFKNISSEHLIDRLEVTDEKSFVTWDSRSRNRTITLRHAIDGSVIATFTADYDILKYTFSREENSLGLILLGKETPAAIRLRLPLKESTRGEF